MICVGTNDLPTRRQPVVIAEDIIELALKLNTNSCDVSVLNIVARNNQYRKKASAVNHKLKDLCKEKNLHYIDHSNSIITRHLNGSKLLLNTKGTKTLSSNFVEAVSSIPLSYSITHSLSDSNCDHMIDKCKIEPMNMKDIENLKGIRKRNLNRLVVAHLNINSLKNKFDCLIEQFTGNINILMISETKLDSSFPTVEFLSNGYNEPFRIDWNSKGDGLCYM